MAHRPHKSHENRRVTPANAGVHKLTLPLWIPAPRSESGTSFAGMTLWGAVYFHRNSPWPAGHIRAMKTSPSLPRRRESRFFSGSVDSRPRSSRGQALRGNDDLRALAGYFHRNDTLEQTLQRRCLITRRAPASNPARPAEFPADFPAWWPEGWRIRGRSGSPRRPGSGRLPDAPPQARGRTVFRDC